MAAYKTIEDVKLKGKKTFMRVDFNVLNEDGSMGSTKRLEASLPTINYIREKGGKLILGTHVKRPAGHVVEKWRTKPIKKELEELLGGKNVYYVDDCVGPKVEKAVAGMNNGDILLLENLRFRPEEEADKSALARPFVKQLANFIDVYVLDGFAAAHRAHTSTVWLPLYLIEQGMDVVAGYLMKQELDYWGPIATGEHGGVAIVSGAKLKEKMLAIAGDSKRKIEGFPSMFDNVVVGGVVANVFLKGAGYEIGKSKYTEKDEKTGEEKKYTSKAKAASGKYNNIILPRSVVLDGNKDKGVGVKDITSEGSIADTLLEEGTIGAIRSAPRVVVFGTMGRFEDGYTKGTDQLVAVLSDYKGLLRIGGGDAEKALKEKIKVPISTGGGASIEYILLGTLPGLEALKGNFEYFKKKSA